MRILAHILRGTDYYGAVGTGLVSAGQDIDRIKMEHSWKDWVGDDGVARLSRAVVHYVCPAERAGYQRATLG
jgi:hypothetical protein